MYATTLFGCLRLHRGYSVYARYKFSRYALSCLIHPSKLCTRPSRSKRTNKIAECSERANKVRKCRLSAPMVAWSLPLGWGESQDPPSLIVPIDWPHPVHRTCPYHRLPCQKAQGTRAVAGRSAWSVLCLMIRCRRQRPWPSHRVLKSIYSQLFTLHLLPRRLSPS